MSKTLLIVTVVALCSLHAWSQTLPVRVKGRITDKESLQPLADATVALLYARDSTRAVSGFTDQEGAFVLEGLSPGDYKLYVTYLGYRPVLQAMTVTDSDTLVNLGVIAIQGTGVNLKTVEIVRVRAPMVVKKDTLEFNADFYKTRENAVMEELLKKLPGVQVDPDGTIKVNGEPVKRILVDGRPFFGDDPKLATRNLPADMIDKVQLIDKKSDQAEFSGVDDGKREKAINITVKKDRKGSFFGRAAAGYGTEGRFAGNGNLNRFSNGEQLTFLGGANNVNNTGFLNGSGGGGGGEGITRNWNAGVNYSKDIGEKVKLSGSYVVSDDKTENERKSARQNLLPDTTYYYNQEGKTEDKRRNHSLNVRVEYEPDSMQNLVFLAALNHTGKTTAQQNQYESLGDKQQKINSGSIYNTNEMAAPNISSAFFWAKRFNKPGRTFTSSLGIGYSKDRQEGINISTNLFTQSNGEVFGDTVNQRVHINNQQRALSFYFIFTEPILKDRFLDLNYSYATDYAISDKLTYDFSSGDKDYVHLNDSLSNSFKNVSSLHRAVISLRTRKANYDYSLGVNLQLSNLDNEDISKHRNLQQGFFGIFPSASFNYTFKNNSHFRFFYAGSIQQPDARQLQPVPDNSNPLYIQLGNAELKPAFVHNFNAAYNIFNAGSMRSTAANLNAYLISNKIIMANWIDSLGRQVSQPLNMNGAYNIGFNISNGFSLKRRQTAVNTNTSIVFNRDVNFVNEKRGYTKNFNVTQSITFNYSYKELLDFGTAASINYNSVAYSMQDYNNVQYFNYNLSIDCNIKLPIGMGIGGNLGYIRNTGQAAGYNQSAVLMNAFVTKTVFRSKQGLFKLQVFDLFNQNISVRRNIGESYIEDIETSILRRFFMISFSYFLNKAGGSK